MITLNKLAVKCYDIALCLGKINRFSSGKAFILAISAEWRKLFDATKYRSEHLPKYSEQEEAAAGIIISTLTYLRRIGCEDIERLIKDKIKFDEEQKD